MAPEPRKEQLARWRAYDTNNCPFLDLQSPFTLWEEVKMALLLWTLIPKAIVGLSALFLLALTSFIAAFGVPLDKPFPAWRRGLVVLGSNLAGVVVWSLGFIVRVKGRHNIKLAREVGAIAAFNHTSYVDAPAIMWLLAPSGVSKASNANLPILGTCIKAYQNIYVPRESIDTKKDAATTADPSGPKSAPAVPISKLIAERAKDPRFPMLAMAPEGTCGDGRCILRFRTGAFVAGVPVLPVLLTYRKKHLNPAWTIIYEYWHFLRLICQFFNYLEINILPPYMPSQAEKDDPLLYAQNVRKLFADTLGVPMVDQSQEDFVALTKAGVRVNWRGTRVIAPPGVLNEDGTADLTLSMKKLS